jgi:Response regulator receiver domain
LARTVLIGDDDPMVLAILQDILEDLGCDVITAASADEALDWLSSNREIALLVSDVNMPKMDGVEFAERAGQIRKDVKNCADLRAPGKAQWLCDAVQAFRTKRPSQSPSAYGGTVLRQARAHTRSNDPIESMDLANMWRTAFNGQVLVYGRGLPGEPQVVVIPVNLDPFNVQEVTFELPLAHLGVAHDGTMVVEDLMRGQRSLWMGALQRVRLDPHDLPFAIWCVSNASGPLP